MLLQRFVTDIYLCYNCIQQVFVIRFLYASDEHCLGTENTEKNVWVFRESESSKVHK